MSVYYSKYRDMLVLKCDGCGEAVDLYKGETDRLLAHDYIRTNGWKTTRSNGVWINICPECKKAVQDQRRRSFAEKVSTQ